MADAAAIFSKTNPVLTSRPRRWLPSPRRIALVVVAAALVAVLFIPLTKNTYLELFGETLFVGMALLLAFQGAGATNPKKVPRWVAQVVGVAVAAVLAPLFVQLFTAGGSFERFIGSHSHVRGYVLVTLVAMVIGLLVALGSLYREREAEAESQALQIALLRETLERQATDARLQLLTAQIQPHFLLNTLANVQELVESGSPRAVPLFRSLIAYLRAAMPHLQQGDATLADEEQLVRAYLELMQMRMPDRLAFSVEIDPALRTMRFPPMALLTLVENAIHHGVDPHVDASRVEVRAGPGEGGVLRIAVIDTGVGMSEKASEGTGLTNLRARMRAFFGETARLELSEHSPRGLRAELVIPQPA
ncbi:sensor histidine kinase [Ramlibacter albus]|uniref:Histidine kinase n=1 Tax=Ramlibacter albus TaxID=2079448 RepID=A0A923M8K8_9BURK|nr:histidine kinase [Ramlibacter albus]MBC5766287.1 histidine kinase [Ramlibacter albus]